MDLSLTSSVETTTYTTSSSDDTSSSTTNSTLNISNITIQRKDLASPVVFTNQDNQLVQNGEPVDDVLSSQLNPRFPALPLPVQWQCPQPLPNDLNMVLTTESNCFLYRKWNNISFTIGNGLTEAELPEQENR